MNRNEEYKILLTELENTPPALENTVEKALTRESASHKKWHFFGIPAVSLAACFAGFILLVNLSVPFARACGTVPVLRELAKAVAWSPSLSAAVENDYVQPIEQTQTENGITASVKYVIVDRKQVSVFFTLDNDLRIPGLDFRYDITLPGDRQGYNSTTGSYGRENGELRQIDVNFVDTDVPSSLDLTLRIYDSTTDWEPNTAPVEEDYGDTMLSGDREPKRDYLAEFTFTLEFDPYFTAQGEVIPVDTGFILDGQTVTVTEAEIYPTHLRLNFSYDPDNTAWLTGLNFYLENEHGDRYETTTNGVSAVGDPDTSALVSFWVDSPFFSQGEHLTLRITGAEWLNKDQEKVKLDLVRGTAENLPEGILLEWTEHRDGGWIVSTSAPYRWGSEMIYQIWRGGFYDAEGNEHDILSHSSTNSPMFFDSLSGEELAEYEAYAKANRDRYFETFPLKDYHADEVWLMPGWSRVTTENPPVTIPIK